MSVLINKETRLLVQGLGGAGRFHADRCIAYGTEVIAATHPIRAGEQAVFQGITDHSGVPDRSETYHRRVPIFATVRDAVSEANVNASMIFVPAPFAADAIMEAAEAGIPIIVAITEHIPILDMVRVKRYLEGGTARLIGPNCPGIITPRECKIGIMPGYIHQPGRIGVISRSGTLTYEAVHQLSRIGLGQTTAVGIGGDPVTGTNFIDVLTLFEADPDTHGVILIGEIGGSAEEEAAGWIEKYMTKPVAAFIAGITAPPGKRMGHAGALISGGQGTADKKISALESVGVVMAETPSDMGEAMLFALRRSEAASMQNG
jgi:succinyl-CoA synthetase alpha subunit